MQKTITTIILLIVSLLVATKIRSFIKNNAPVQPAPVEDVKNPEPIATTTPVVKTTFGLDELFEFNGVPMKVLSIVEDSRCPSDVNCIQAGRARISLDVASSTFILEIGKTITAENLNITLDEVVPYPTSKQKIMDTDYRFSFTIKPI